MRAGAVLAREDAVLERKIHAGRIDQIDDRHAVAHRDFLRAQNLGDGLGPPRAGLHRGVVGNDHGRAAFDLADARDHARRGRLPVVLVVGDQQADFEKTRPGSSSWAMRSRAVSLPSRCCFSIFLAPPPCRSCSSSTCSCLLCSRRSRPELFICVQRQNELPKSEKLASSC